MKKRVVLMIEDELAEWLRRQAAEAQGKGKTRYEVNQSTIVEEALREHRKRGIK
jgi:hypothetical protein